MRHGPYSVILFRYTYIGLTLWLSTSHLFFHASSLLHLLFSLVGHFFASVTFISHPSCPLRLIHLWGMTMRLQFNMLILLLFLNVYNYNPNPIWSKRCIRENKVETFKRSDLGFLTDFKNSWAVSNALT